MNKVEKNALLIFLLLGVAAIVGGYIVIKIQGPKISEEGKYISAALQGLGFAILTVAIISGLWNFLGGDPVSTQLQEGITTLQGTQNQLTQAVKLVSDSHTTGLTRVFAVSSDWGKSSKWMQRIKDAKSNIDLMGYDLHVWTTSESFESELVKTVTSGVHVRILIMDENNPDLSTFVNERDIPAIGVANVIANIGGMRRTCASIAVEVKGKTNVSGSFEFRTLKKGLIVTQICRTDSQTTAVQYLFSQVASRNPLVEVREILGKECLFSAYSKEFSILWKSAGLPPLEKTEVV